MWDGHRLYVGRPRAGKTYLALSHLAKKGGPRIFVDLAADAATQGIAITGADDLGPCRRALKAAQCLHYRSAGVAYAKREVAALMSLAEEVARAEGLPDRGEAVTILVDEAHHVSGSGVFEPRVLDAAAQGRHLGIELWQATPLPQAVEYTIRQPAEHKFCGALDWSPWMATQWGLSKEELESLAEFEFWHVHDGKKERVRA